MIRREGRGDVGGWPIRQSTVQGVRWYNRLFCHQARWEREGEAERQRERDQRGGRWRGGRQEREKHRSQKDTGPQATGRWERGAGNAEQRTENRHHQTPDGCKDGQTHRRWLSRWGHQVDWRPTPPAPPCAPPSSICGFDFIVVSIPPSLSTRAWLARPPTGECCVVVVRWPLCDVLLRCVALASAACRCALHAPSPLGLESVCTALHENPCALHSA